MLFIAAGKSQSNSKKATEDTSGYHKRLPFFLFVIKKFKNQADLPLLREREKYEGFDA